MKIGVLATGFNCSEYFNQVLEPWLQYKEKHGDLLISVVNTLFKENEDVQQDDSSTLMLNAFDQKKINYLARPHGAYDEAATRNIALTPLLAAKVDYIILLDFDEIYTLEQIEKIFEFVKMNPLTAWFKIHFKNFVIDTKHYVDDFVPPRIFKRKIITENDNFLIKHFYYDNDVTYSNEEKDLSYKALPSMNIPKNIAWINHYSWCGDPVRLQQKIKYQNSHFGFCSYRWNNEQNKIELNLDFYKDYHVEIPKIYSEND